MATLHKAAHHHNDAAKFHEEAMQHLHNAHGKHTDHESHKEHVKAGRAAARKKGSKKAAHY